MACFTGAWLCAGAYFLLMAAPTSAYDSVQIAVQAYVGELPDGRHFQDTDVMAAVGCSREEAWVTLARLAAAGLTVGVYANCCPCGHEMQWAGRPRRSKRCFVCGEPVRAAGHYPLNSWHAKVRRRPERLLAPLGPRSRLSALAG
jgi:hypothetical protein